MKHIIKILKAMLSDLPVDKMKFSYLKLKQIILFLQTLISVEIVTTENSADN